MKPALKCTFIIPICYSNDIFAFFTALYENIRFFLIDIHIIIFRRNIFNTFSNFTSSPFFERDTTKSKEVYVLKVSACL